MWNRRPQLLSAGRCLVSKRGGAGGRGSGQALSFERASHRQAGHGRPTDVADALPDRDSFVKSLQDERARLTSDRQRTIIDVVVEHVLAEIVDFDIERVMATMVDEPRHEFYGLPGILPLLGYDAVRSYYLRTFEEAGPSRGSMEVERLIVGDDALVKLGTVVYSGQGLRVRAPEVAVWLDLSRPCVLRKRMCHLMPFEGNRIIAEIHYFDGPFTIDDVRYLDGPEPASASTPE